MKTKFLLIPLLAIVFTSCSTAYKSGQTPDDVYYSPVKMVEDDNDDEKEEQKITDKEEKEIRMATRDRRWRDFDDDYNYRYDPYHYGYSYGYYYNPYYCHNPVYINSGYIVNPKNSTARMANLGSYTHTTQSTSPGKTGNTIWVNSGRPYNTSNSSGTYRRTILFPGSEGRSSSGSNDNRSYSPSSSSSRSSSGSSSSGSSRPVNRPSRGN